jgi:hypothetical protein
MALVNLKKKNQKTKKEKKKVHYFQESHHVVWFQRELKEPFWVSATPRHARRWQGATSLSRKKTTYQYEIHFYISVSFTGIDAKPQKYNKKQKQKNNILLTKKQDKAENLPGLSALNLIAVHPAVGTETVFLSTGSTRLNFCGSFSGSKFPRPFPTTKKLNPCRWVGWFSGAIIAVPCSTIWIAEL